MAGIGLDEKKFRDEQNESGLVDGLAIWPDTLDIEGIQKGCDFLASTLKSPGADFFSRDNLTRRLAFYSVMIRLHRPGGDDKQFERLKSAIEKLPGFSEIEFDVEIATAKETGPRFCSSIASNPLIKHKGCEKCVYRRKIKSPIQIQTPDFPATENTGFWDVVINKDGSVRRTKPNYVDLHKKFKQKYVYKSVDGAIYVYKDNHWHGLDELRLENFAENHFDPKPSTSMCREFVHKCKINSLVEREWFNESTENLINLQNGVFNVQTRELKPHSPDYGFQYILPYAYDPKATGAAFQGFLDSITKGDFELQKVITEYLGYAISNAPCYAEKAMFLYGPSASNGKSTLINAIYQLVGRKNYSSLTLDALNKDTKRYMLEGKLFNVSEETNVRALSDSEVFKVMVTGGEIDVKKLYVQDYSIRNRAKLIVLCNDMPKSGDHTDGLYRRILLVPLTARFDDSLGNRIANMGELLSKDLPGMFNLCIDGFERLKNQNWKFTKSAIVDEVMEEYKRENDNVLKFYYDCLEWTDHPHDSVSKEMLFQHYVSFCDSNGYKWKANQDQFMKKIKETRGPRFKEERRQKLHERVRSIIGVKLIAD